VTVKESEIERHLEARVNFLGGECQKLDSRGRKGRCDRIVTFPMSQSKGDPRAHTFFVELKKPGERPDPHQRHEHKRLRDRGFVVLVLDSIEAIDEFLEGFSVYH
jgi:hypothetical protein